MLDTDRQHMSARRVLRLVLITALFAVVCGLPGSLSAMLHVLRTLSGG